MKQGDSISPALFILATEVLSRALNFLLRKKKLTKFGMPRESPSINHLAFVYDMIILCKAEVGTMKIVDDTLDQYERIFGQKINKEGKWY